MSYKPSVEQNIVRLSGNTTLKIDTLTVSDTGVDTVSDTELDLQNGRIFSSVKKLSAESKYLIKFPNGIAGVRGSQGFMPVVDGRLGACGALVHPLWLTVTSPVGRRSRLRWVKAINMIPPPARAAPLSAGAAQLVAGNRHCGRQFLL